jgi:hypothetical protein
VLLCEQDRDDRKIPNRWMSKRHRSKLSLESLSEVPISSTVLTSPRFLCSVFLNVRFLWDKILGTCLIFFTKDHFE